MKEDFLHYIWKYQLLDFSRIQTVQNEPVQVIFPGIHNHDSGPDFLNAKLRIDDQVWVGTVEIHLNSSHWYWHQHEIDENYDAVILHVVWDHDVDVFMKNNLPLPTLELKHLVSQELLENYKNLSKNSSKWIPCEDQLSKLDSFLVNNWLERLFIERLEKKAIAIQELLSNDNNNWDAVLFSFLAKNFGLNKNGLAFYELSRSFPFSLFQRLLNEPKKLESLLFGQGGFLEQDKEDVYHKQLKKEYDFLKIKYDLHPKPNQNFQFFRMRPSNFPTIRIAQLTSLYADNYGLFSKLMTVDQTKDYYQFFDIQMNEFWKTHYTFDKASKKSSKKLTRSFIDLVIINTIIPLKFAYMKARDKDSGVEILQLINEIKPEKNSVVDKFRDLGIAARSAFESQALLQLKNNYCATKRCLDCAIGNKILRS